MKNLLLAFLLFAATAQGAAAIFSTVISGLGEEYAAAVASDAQGNAYVAGLTYSPDFPVTAGAYQTTFGQTCDAFIAKVGTDGKVIWSTYLGGILDDWATGVALDSSGNVWVTGYTRSPNFPLVNPIQSDFTGFEGFVAELDPTGSKLLYSTILSGQGQTGAAGIALDQANNVYVAMNTLSAAGYPGIPNLPAQAGILVSKLTPQGALAYTYFYPNGSAGGIAVDSTGAVYVAGSYPSASPSSASHMFGPPGAEYAVVFKLSPDGSTKVFETGLGGSVQSYAMAIALAPSGKIWVAGSTAAADFPLQHPYQSSLGTRPLWTSADGGTTWTPLDGLPFALPQALLADPSTPRTLYVATADLGIFKSLDGGSTWTQSTSGIVSPNVTAIAIDPVHPQVLYAVTPLAAGVDIYKSADGAHTWSQIDSTPYPISQLAVDPLNTNNVYEIGVTGGYTAGYIRKSTDAGVTWNNVAFPAALQSLVLDPHTSGNLVATSFQETAAVNNVGFNMAPYFWRSIDGGADWNQNQTVTPSGGLVIDASTTPATIYDSLAFRSSDAGVTWSALPQSAVTANVVTVAVDLAGAVYAVTANGLFVSHDHAQTWTAIGSPAYPVANIVPVGSNGTLYALMQNRTAPYIPSGGLEAWTSGFVTELSADGSTIEYSTYLRGHPAAVTGPLVTAKPVVFETHNWIDALALDPAGNVVLAGGTRATDFPTANPVQAANAGLADAFVAVLSPDGSHLNYSTYFGGSQDDSALALALDPQGHAIIAGQTWSTDFPVPGGLTPPYGLGDAFVVKLAVPAPPVIASVLSAASYQPAIASSSWVMIKGAGLSNTTRTWATSDFNGANLPTALDGVGVTIDGIPAFVEYISPTQINVLAPADSTLGNVNVVVNNNGALSSAATAQYLALAPAFFLYGATNYAVASRLLDYAEVGNPSAPASPGDTLVLWGSGFGATNPPANPAVTVSGAPVVTPTPTVTVGGMSVPVISAVMTTGSAGLYQITIQLPANVPTGSVMLQALTGNSQTPAGVMLDIGK